MKSPCRRCGSFDAAARQCMPCKRAAETAKYANDEAYREARKALSAATKAVQDPATRAAYQRELYHRRRRDWVAYLGGVCVGCGTTEDLEIDHVERWTKSFDLGRMWSRPWAFIEPELDKCQLLCGTCHQAKTSGEARSHRRLGPPPLSGTSDLG